MAAHRNPPFQLDYQRVVVGYHGCDKAVVEKVLLQSQHLNPSDNPWDWLGKGIYFWEFGPQRALAFAREQQARGKVDEPAVIGAYTGRSMSLRSLGPTSTWGVVSI